MLSRFNIGGFSISTPYLLMTSMCKRSSDLLFLDNQYMFGFVPFITSIWQSDRVFYHDCRIGVKRRVSLKPTMQKINQPET